MSSPERRLRCADCYGKGHLYGGGLCRRCMGTGWINPVPADPHPISHPNPSYRQMWWRAGWRHAVKGWEPMILPATHPDEYRRAYQDGYASARAAENRPT